MEIEKNLRGMQILILLVKIGLFFDEFVLIYILHFRYYFYEGDNRLILFKYLKTKAWWLKNCYSPPNKETKFLLNFGDSLSPSERNSSRKSLRHYRELDF